MAEPEVGEKVPELQKKLLKYYEREELFSYLLFNKDIWTKTRTSNHTERINRKLRKKQKTHYRIRKKDRREKMIRFMIYFHNMKALGKNPVILIFFLLCLVYSKE